LKESRLSSVSASLHEVLQRIPLFAGIDPSVLEMLQRASTRRHIEKGAYLFFRGDPAECFYLLLFGNVSIILTSPDGRELIINVMHPGDFFGELALLTGQPRSADAVARSACDVVSIPREAFMKALEREPSMSRTLLEVTAHRLSRSSEFEDSLAFLDAQTRLARVLLDMDGENKERGYITASQQELAQRAGLIRQTVARSLGQWRRAGWLLTGRGHIVLLNRNALRMWFKQKAG
jgi:CRP-like cAMP-binding protein